MPTDVFPYATNKTRHKDIDHTIAYTATGPPGQTGIGNLAPITRRHHRIKTHSRWKVETTLPRHPHLAITPRRPLPRRQHRHPPHHHSRLTRAVDDVRGE